MSYCSHLFFGQARGNDEFNLSKYYINHYNSDRNNIRLKNKTKNKQQTTIIYLHNIEYTHTHIQLLTWC